MDQDTHSVTDPIPGSDLSHVTDAAPETICAPQPGTPETRKNAGYFWPIGYVVFSMVYGPVLFFALGESILSIANYDSVKRSLDWVPAILIAVIPVAIWLVFPIGNIVRSFRMKGEDAPLHCIRAMLILRYGMIPFYILHAFLSPVAGYAMIYFSRMDFYRFGITYFFVAPLFFLLPGSFYGIRVVRMSLLEKKIRLIPAILHGIAQFIPVLGVLDAAYLSAVKWKTARIITLVIVVIMPLLIVLILAFPVSQMDFSGFGRQY